MRTGTHNKTNRDWLNHVVKNATDGYPNDIAILAVLMDIRQELRSIGEILGCPNFREIPQTLKGIRRKLPNPKRSNK